MWLVHNSSSLLTPFPAPAWVLPMSLQSFRRTYSGLGSSVGCSADICSSVVLSTCCRGIPAPPWSLPKLPGAAGESLPQHLEHLLPSSFSHLGDCSVVPHTFSPLTPQCLYGALSFLKHHRRGATSSAEGLSCALRWGPVELAGTGCVRHEAAPAPPHRDCPCSPTTTKTLTSTPHIFIYNTKQHQLQK